MPFSGYHQTTMEDVARECGVTKKTVSRVFAGSPLVKASTREKILEAAKRLNYEFNTLAQNLSAKRSRFIGVATSVEHLFGSNYFSELFKGFASVLNTSDWDFAFFDTDAESFNHGEKLARLFRQRRVDGLLVVAPHNRVRFLDTLEQRHVPMIVVGVLPPGTGICSVSCDDARGVTLLCEHLYGLGHRRIGFISGPPYVTTSDLRTQAFVDFCRAKKLKCPPGYIRPGYYAAATGKEAAAEILAASPRPTAIIAANDLSAMGAIECAHELGLSVPGDLSIAGFDDLPIIAGRIPPLTTIHQPVREMGQKSASFLLDCIQKRILPSGNTVMDVTLLPRATTARPSGRK